MEQIIDLFGGMRLIQDSDGFKLGSDSILLANFPILKKYMRVCDFGCGGGCIPLILLSLESTLAIDAVELDSAAAELARRNAELNGVHYHVFNEDMRSHTGEYDLVISNPPYFAAGRGRASGKDTRLAREESCTIDELCASASAVLRHGGELCIIIRSERLPEAFHAMRAATLEPKRLRLVCGTLEAVPKLALVMAKKGAKPSLEVMPVLVVRNPDGAFTDEVSKFYEGETR